MVDCGGGRSIAVAGSAVRYKRSENHVADPKVGVSEGKPRVGSASKITGLRERRSPWRCSSYAVLLHFVLARPTNTERVGCQEKRCTQLVHAVEKLRLLVNGLRAFARTRRSAPQIV